MKLFSYRLLLLFFVMSGIQSLAQTTHIYWINENDRSINSFRLSDSQNSVLLESTVSAPFHIEFDAKNQKVYWADSQLGKISRSNPDGTGVEEIVSYGGNSQFEGLAIDTLNNMLYWRLFGGIERSNLDGTAREVINSNIGNGDIAVDPTNNSLYWISNTDLIRSNLDGTGETVLTSSIESDFYHSLVIDPDDGHLYFGLNNAATLNRINTDGTGLQAITTGIRPEGIALDKANNHIYTYDRNQRIVLRYNIDGTNQVSVSNPILEVNGFSGVDIAFSNGFIYTARPAEVLRINPTTLAETPLISSQIASPFDLTTNLDRLIFTDFYKGELSSYSINAEEKSTILSGLFTPFNIISTQNSLYWTGAGGSLPGAVFSSSLNGANPIEVFNDANNQRPRDIVVDESQGFLYFTVAEWISNVGQVRWVSTSGGADQQLINSTTADQIAFDPDTRVLYWNEDSQLFSISLQTFNTQEIFIPDFFPLDIKIDSEGGKIYWIDGAEFRRANLDGSLPETLGTIPGFASTFTLYDSIAVRNALQPTVLSDSLALVEFYQQTNGPNWDENNWLQEGNNVATWQGVTVEEGRVVGINLSDFNLSGSLPAALSDLTELRELNLSANPITGSIPVELTTLSNLETLNLSNNFFMEGAVPAEIVNLSNLLDLNLANCNFDNLPDISSLISTIVQVQNNRLQFDDLEPNISLPAFSYIPQKPVTEDSIQFFEGSDVLLEPSIGGASNQYQWLLNGDTIVDETNSSLLVTSGASGDYRLRISNALVPDLVLETGLFRVTIAPPFVQSPQQQFIGYQVLTELTSSVREAVTVPDMNGDGINDFAILGSNELHVYFGDRQISSKKSPDLTYSFPENHSATNIAAGNFTNDELSDIVFSIYEAQNVNPTIRLILLEGSQGLTQQTLNISEIPLSDQQAEFGIASFTIGANTKSLGDINNDGFDDLGMSSGTSENAVIYFGGQASFGSLSTQISPVANSSFTLRIFPLEDVNNDNIDDFMITRPDLFYGIYFGGDGKTTYDNPDVILNKPETGTQFFGWNAISADVNQDNIKDVLVRPAYHRDPVFTQEGVDAIYIYHGGAAMDDILDGSLRVPRSSENLNLTSGVGLNLFANVGDFDGNGSDDLMINFFGNDFNGYLFPAENLSEASLPSDILIAPIEGTVMGYGNNFINYNTAIAAGDFNDNGIQEFLLGQAEPDGYRVFAFENFTPPGELQFDSLTLVSIYDETDGDNWENNTNWLQGNIDTWEGVELTTSRVTTLDLSGNGLKGQLLTPLNKLLELQTLNLSENELAGSFPSSVLNLPNLTSLNISNNEFNTVPDFNSAASTNLTEINLSANRLDFADLEPIFEIPGLSYADQKNIKLVQPDTVLVPVKTNTTVEVDAGGSQLNYQWRFGQNQIEGAISSTYQVENVNRTKMGDYSVQVTSGVVPDLTLTSDPVKVLATAIVTANVLGTSGELISENVSGSLMETIRRTRGYDTLSARSNVSSSFSFEPVILLDYLIGVSSEPELYVDTYYKDVFLWEEADTLKLFSDTTLSISITTIPQPTEPGDGEGTVSGTIEEDFADDAGRIEARRRAARRKCGLRRRTGGGRPGQTGQFTLFAYGETNDKGEFEFGFLPQGTYRFFVEYPGIPLDQTSFVQFEIGEAGVTDDDFTLAATVTETGIVVELILGLTSRFFTEFSVYPNPTTDRISITYDKVISEHLFMQLIDMNGNTLHSNHIEKGKNGQLELSLQEYEQGMYFLKFFDKKTGDTALTFRILKK